MAPPEKRQSRSFSMFNAPNNLDPDDPDIDLSPAKGESTNTSPKHIMPHQSPEEAEPISAKSIESVNSSDGRDPCKTSAIPVSVEPDETSDRIDKIETRLSEVSNLLLTVVAN